SDFVDEAQLLAQDLRMRVFFAPIYDLPPLTAGAPDRLFGTAILSRYPILSAVNHEITRLSTQDPNPVPAPAPGFPEVVVNVLGVHVHVYDTHLDFRADPAVRQLQVADTLRILGADPQRTVLLGDFNAAPTSPELAPLWAGLTDVLAQTPDNGQLTYPATVPTARDDYVTASPDIGIRDAHVPDIEIDGAQASDHRPVVADLVLQRH
ncbi:MAG TPA: endonuclease/exonuclease/phosphatase family protein, partial [Actinopolymorphaceae bacterium]|nr:endonuclease/exonuclease/phosphatase family protein [Actinopolymorphaceae bacterium]